MKSAKAFAVLLSLSAAPTPHYLLDVLMVQLFNGLARRGHQFLRELDRQLLPALLAAAEWACWAGLELLDDAVPVLTLLRYWEAVAASRSEIRPRARGGFLTERVRRAGGRSHQEVFPVFVGQGLLKAARVTARGSRGSV